MNELPRRNTNDSWIVRVSPASVNKNTSEVIAEYEQYNGNDAWHDLYLIAMDICNVRSFQI